MNLNAMVERIQREEKGDLIYQAAMQKDTNGGTYLFQPFEFYAKNNWPTPNENLKKKWFSFE